LQIFGAGMEEEVDVNVDQAGEKSGVAQVDDFGCSGAPDGRTHFDDALVFDEDFAGRDYFSGFDIEEACGMQHSGMLRSGR
jgi:hypothetical protein